MRNEHESLLKEITSKVQLLSVAAGDTGTGQWETGAVGVYTGIMGALGYSCSLPGNFYDGSSYVSSYGDGGYGGYSSSTSSSSSAS